MADDNVDLAVSMGLLLEMMGNEVRVAHDGRTAVILETQFRPDIVFLDIGMAKMNGFDACACIRDKPWGKEPIIVALTGWSSPEDKRRAQEAGFTVAKVLPLAAGIQLPPMKHSVCRICGCRVGLVMVAMMSSW